MARERNYVRLKGDTVAEFSRYIPDIVENGFGGDVAGIGIIRNGMPDGVVLLSLEDSQGVTVQSIRTSTSSQDQGFLKELFATLTRFTKSKGRNVLSYRFADSEKDINEDELRSIGFSKFTEEATVFRLDAYTLGTLLRDNPEVLWLRRQSVRLLDNGKVRVFSKAKREVLRTLSGLRPNHMMSFMSIDMNGNPCAYSAVSELSDGVPFLENVYSKGNSSIADLGGLIYLSLAAVFMHIYPDGEFYIPILRGGYESFVDRIIAPLRSSISIQKIYRAWKEI